MKICELYIFFINVPDHDSVEINNLYLITRSRIQNFFKPKNYTKFWLQQFINVEVN